MSSGDCISIVIPTYQRAPILLRTLPSYLATAAEEVVVVDDGSTAEHRPLLETVASLDRVRLVTLPRHLGLPVARNEGAARTGSASCQRPASRRL